MASEGPNSPGTAVDDSGVGTRTWSNPGNVFSSDNSDASASFTSNGQISHYLKITNFGFSIPSGATIDGIVVSVERARTLLGGAALVDEHIKIVKGGTIGSTNKADTSTDWPTSDTVKSYGSSSDLWGESWSDSDINANDFGCVISAKRTAGFSTFSAFVDHVTITVHYTETVADATVDAETGSVTASSDAATPTATVPGETGSATAAGQEATPTAIVPGVAGSVTADGQAAAMVISSTITAETGSATATGQDATLAISATVDAAVGTATATGQATDLHYDTTIDAETGSVTVDGLAAEAGSLTVIAAEIGSVTANGQDAALAISTALSGEAGSATAGGHAAAVTAATTVDATAGSASASGQPATVTALAPGASGAVTATGQSATAALDVPAETGSAVAGGQAATLVLTIVIEAAVALATVDGLAAIVRDGSRIHHDLVATTLSPPPARPGVSLPTPAGRRSVAL